MKSNGVSLKPPLNPLHKGVRIARVMTISSGFFCVLEGRTWISKLNSMSMWGFQYSHSRQATLALAAWAEVVEYGAESFRSHCCVSVLITLMYYDTKKTSRVVDGRVEIVVERECGEAIAF